MFGRTVILCCFKSICGSLKGIANVPLSLLFANGQFSCDRTRVLSSLSCHFFVVGPPFPGLKDEIKVKFNPLHITTRADWYCTIFGEV